MHVQTRLASPTRSTVIDVTAFLGMFGAFISALFALLIGPVPIAVCVGVAIICGARRRTRPVGVWILAGAALGAFALAGCVLFLAIGRSSVDVMD